MEVARTVFGARGTVFGTHDPHSKLPKEVHHTRTEFGVVPKVVAIRHTGAKEGERTYELDKLYSGSILERSIYDYATG